MNVVAVIQVRMGSTRLPGKSLMELAGKPVIAHVVERTKQAKEVSAVWIATTINKDDDALALWAERTHVPFYRGSVDDVLDRYYQAAKLAKAEVVVRVTGDCPLIDPGVIDEAVRAFKTKGVDYAAANRRVATYPDGLDVEVMSFAVLERAWKEAKLTSEREHVTPYIWKHPRKFKLFILKHKPDWSKYRITLDEQADYVLLRRIFAEVQRLTTENIVAFLDRHNDVRGINKHIVRDEGYAKSLRADTGIFPK